jgi:hypothetical protein
MITEHQHIYSRRQGSGAHLAAARCQHLLLEATIGRKVDEALVIRSSSGSAICGVSHVGVAAAHLESRCCRWVSLCLLLPRFCKRPVAIAPCNLLYLLRRTHQWSIAVCLSVILTAVSRTRAAAHAVSAASCWGLRHAATAPRETRSRV